MPEPPLQIVRYPNRRFYVRNESRYLSLQEIEECVRSGRDVVIRDSQTDEDLTRSVLTRIIMDRQPEKMQLFPVAMLHFILRSNDLMSDFLRDYFRHSLTYLDYLQRHRPATSTLAQPMHWVKAWLEGFVPSRNNGEPGSSAEEATDAENELLAGEFVPAADAAQLARRVAELEDRIRQLEAKEP